MGCPPPISKGIQCVDRGTKLIFINAVLGRMSNRKIVLAHVLAHALARNESICVIEDGGWGRFGFVGVRVVRSRPADLFRGTIGCLWDRLVRALPDACGSRNRCLRLPGVMIVGGWTQFRDYENLKRYGDEIRKWLGFKVSVKLCRIADEIVVGLHKRRGDYRMWKGGIYYYGDETWKRVREEMESEIKQQGRKVRFVVFCDENAARSAEEDQALMSQCDYIIGPPSTFSTWASFMGKVPLLHLMSADQMVRLSEFVNRWV